MADFKITYKNFGRTGIHVGPVCLGSAMFGQSIDEPAATRVIDAALDLGLNMLDTCDKYVGGKSEEIVGRALKANGKRDRLILATKFSRSGVKDPQPPNAYGISRRYIVQAAEGCLRRLQTDYLDLFMIHRPWWDVALDETLRALDDLIRSGKVRYIGTSNYSAWELMESQWAARELGTNRFVVEECAYNLLHRLPERELIPYAQTYGTALITWGPLAVGFFSGRYRRGEKPDPKSRIQPDNFWKDMLTEPAFRVLDVVEAIAKEKNCTPVQLALAWVAQQPGVTCPIIGPLSVEALHDNLGAFNVTLTADDRTRLDAVAKPGSALVADPAFGFQSQPHPFRW